MEEYFGIILEEEDSYEEYIPDGYYFVDDLDGGRLVKKPVKSELEVFDGRDNREEIMRMLFKLGSDKKRADFLESLIPLSLKGFSQTPLKVKGDCDAVAAYFMLVGICNEIGVSINEAARRLERKVKKQ